MARQDNIPRGRTIPMGAVPVEARGLRHMVPTYLRRRPGSPSNGRLGSALYVDGFSDWRRLELDERRSEGGSAPRRSRPASGGRTRGGARSQPPPMPRKDWASRASGVLTLSRPFIRCATSRTRSPFLPRLPTKDSRPPCRSVVGRGSPLTFRLWRPGEPTRAGAMSIREPLEEAPGVDPDSCSSRLPASTGAATASAMAPAITTGAWPTYAL